ncbi:MAG: 30S ribosomal protein S6 [Candidatus Omnitrophica bacterium]|nr:30S ribosomal protein S6 [Candidatus Omnitrophota bacterium]
MNNYESVFIVKAALDSTAQEKLLEEIKNTITKNNGEITQVQPWGKKKLAYLIEKQSDGIYYFLEFKLIPALVKKIDNLFKLNESILRVMIIRK